jgi:hypothetical protein
MGVPLMKPRLLTAIGVAAVLLSVPSIALAKGASGAVIDGGAAGGPPGEPITLSGDGEPGSGTDLATLAELSGLFVLMFEDGRGAMDSAPSGPLGIRYRITWTFPDERGAEAQIVQYVYPDAPSGPVTFLASGQPIFGESTRGGWFQAPDALRRHLASLGVVTGSEDSPAPAAAATVAPTLAWAQITSGLFAMAFFVVVAVLAVRRSATRVAAAR